MRILFAGTPDVAVVALEALVGSRHTLAGVITRPDAPKGRGRGVSRSPVAARADELGVPVLAPASSRDPAFVAAVRALEPDCCPVVAYGQLLPSDVLDVPEHGWVNLHFSLLPAWRGAAPVAWAILTGDDVTGACTFQIGPGLDDGPIFGTVTEGIRPEDTTGDLLARLAHSGSELLVATLDAIEDGRAMPIPQPEVGVTFAPKLTVEDGRVRWTDPLVAVDRRIRAMTPSPGAWTMLGADRVRLGALGITPSEAPSGLMPGEILAAGSVVWVGTATDPAALGEVKPEGRRMMAAADWIRGLRVERLEFA
jgi:methionyl-tRNA formyltransferase